MTQQEYERVLWTMFMKTDNTRQGCSRLECAGQSRPTEPAARNGVSSLHLLLEVSVAGCRLETRTHTNIHAAELKPLPLLILTRIHVDKTLNCAAEAVLCFV